MRVTISSSGRFHHFDLARQLHRKKCLECLYTGYLRRQVEGIPRGMITSVPWLIAPMMLASRHDFSWLARTMNGPAVQLFDRIVASKMKACDILVCNHSNGLRSYQAARRLGARTVCDCGQAHVNFIRETLRAEYERWGEPFQDYSECALERRLAEYAEADLITVPSKFCAQTFVRNGVDSGKLAVVPYGVDLSLFRPFPKQDSIFRVLFVGTLEIRKGLGCLLEAFAGLKLPNIELVTIGGVGDGFQKLFAKFKDEVRWRHLGFLPRTELARYYSQGSVLVLPSLVEGLALVMAQAMACGLPVIATANAGAEDLFTDGVEGFVVTPGNSAALRDRIGYLYDHPPIREQMAEAALQRVRGIGGWDRYGDHAVRAYETLLARAS